MGCVCLLRFRLIAFPDEAAGAARMTSKGARNPGKAFPSTLRPNLAAGRSALLQLGL
jgi:hypothetical protein